MAMDIIIIMSLLIIFILPSILAYQACPSIQIKDYTYDLSSMAQLDNIGAFIGSKMVQISPCSPVRCEGGTQETYVLVNQGSACQPYTGPWAPLRESYEMVEQKTPKKGIKIKFIPKFSPQSGNTTHTYSASLWVMCNIDGGEKTSCSLANQTDALNTNHYLTCTLYDSAGCPKLALNHFWDFLNRNSIIMAILIWVSGLFLALFGYVAIRMTILLTGVYTGVFFGTVFSAQEYTNFFMESNGIFIYVICLSTLLGTLFGIFLLTVPKLGYLNIGLWAALVFTLLMQNSVLYLTGSMTAFYITLGVVGLLMAAVSQMEFHWFVIFCSSLTGAFWIIRSIGFFLPSFPNQFSSSANLSIGIYTPWQFYLYLCSIIVFTILGMVFQNCLLRKLGYRGRNSYYLENRDPLREKIKKIMEFKQIKEMLKDGKKEIVQLKKMIADSDSSSQNDHYIEMKEVEQKNEARGRTAPKNYSEESDNQ